MSQFGRVFLPCLFGEDALGGSHLVATATGGSRSCATAWWGEPLPSGTSAHGPSNFSAPFSTACISAPVQRFVFGSHSTFGLGS